MAEPELTNNPFFPPTSGRCVINELPSELLSHIFTVGWTPERDQEDEEDDFEDVDDGESDEGSYSSDSSVSDDDRSPEQRVKDAEDAKALKLPFNELVSHVCGRWRAVALSNPLLWNHITFEGKPPYERALTYLARAGTSPLALFIDRTVDEDGDDYSDSDYSEDDEDGVKDNDPDLGIITGIMDVIVPHIEHTLVLQITVSIYPHMHRALERLGACPGAPLLQVLQLYHYEETDEHVKFKWDELRAQPFTLFGGHVPRLAHVALWGVHVDWSPEGSSYLAGLTDLELAYHARDVRPTFHQFARILRASPDLRTLTLCLSCPAGTPAEWPSGLPQDDQEEEDAESPSSAAPLVLPKLTQLVLAYLEPAYLLSLLPRLAFPALSSLALDLEDDDYSSVLAYLASPRSLPQPPARPLSLRGPGVAGAPRSLLSNLTSLKIASLPGPTDTLVADAYRQLEALTALNLHVGYLGDVWFDLLFPATTGSALGGLHLSANELLLPRLTSLTTTGVDGSRMRELVEARRARGAPVKTVLMNQDDEVDEEDEGWLGRHLERFEYFEGSDEEEVDLLPDEMMMDDDDEDDLGGFGTDDEGWEDEEDDEDDGFGLDGEIIVLPF